MYKTCYESRIIPGYFETDRRFKTLKEAKEALQKEHAEWLWSLARKNGITLSRRIIQRVSNAGSKTVATMAQNGSFY